MDLPTYTNIWRIEKRLYKLYDLRLPMPLPINWIAVFAGITIPYIVLLIAIGVPLNHDLLWLYVLPPGVLTWATTRPVLESKRLPELVESQARYLTEPRTWVRLQPLSEKDQMVLTARIFHHRAKRPAAARPSAPAIARQALPAAERDRQASPLRPAPGPVLKPTSVFRPEPGQAVAQGPVRGRRGPAVPPRARAQERARGQEPRGQERDQERVRVRERSRGSGLGPGTPRRAPELPPVRPVQSAGLFIPVLPAAAPEPSGPPAHAMPDVVPAAAAFAPPSAPSPPSARSPQPARSPRLAPSPQYAPAPQPAPGPQSASGSPSAPVRTPESAPPPGPASQPSPTFRPAPVRPAPPADSPAVQAPPQSGPAPQPGPTGVPARARAGRPGGGSLEVSHDGPRRRPGAGQAPWARPAPPVQPAPPASPGTQSSGPQSPVQSPVEQGPATPLAPAAPVLDWPVPARPLRPVPSTPEEQPAPATPADPAAPEQPATSTDEHQAPADPAPAAPAAAVFVPAALAPHAPAQAVPPRVAAPAAMPAPVAPAPVAPDEAAPAPIAPLVPDEAPPATHVFSAAKAAAPASSVPDSAAPASWIPESAPLAPASIVTPAAAAPVPPSPAEAPVPAPAEPAPSLELAASVAPPAEAALAPPAQAPAPAPMAALAPAAAPAPAPTVQQVADVKLPSIERALSGPSRDMNAPWGGKVKIVTGNGAMPGPGARDQEAQDRNRARLPVAEPKRILVLGCTSGAGQSVTTLMTASMLASLREHPVAAVDLHDGTLARYRAPAAWLEELLAGKPPQHIRPTRPDGLHPTPKPSPARLDVVASHEPLKEGDEIKLAVQLNRHYPLTLLDPGASALTRLLKVTDQLVVVVPANVDAAGALADTRDWLDNNGHADLAMQSVTVINGVSRRSLPDVESAESIARGRSRAIVRVPWDDMLPVAAASPSTLRPQTRVAYTALAGVLVAGLAAAPVRKKP